MRARRIYKKSTPGFKYTAWINGVAIASGQTIAALRTQAENVFNHHCQVKYAIFEIWTGVRNPVQVLAEPWERGGELPRGQNVCAS